MAEKVICKDLKEVLDAIEKGKKFILADTLATLDLGGSNIGSDGAKYLSDSLKVNNTLTYLNLRNNNIGDVGAQSLLDMLKVNYTLTNHSSGTTYYPEYFVGSGQCSPEIQNAIENELKLNQVIKLIIDWPNTHFSLPPKLIAQVNECYYCCRNLPNDLVIVLVRHLIISYKILHILF